jgi:hypothetical protein
MPLKMRPPGLGHGVYKDVPDYGIFCGEWCIGRSMKLVPALRGYPGSGRSMLPQQAREPAHLKSAATLDEAKAEFEASWKQWKAWAGMEEVD